MPRRARERDELWGEVERELRRFIDDYLWQPEWLWSAETVRLMRVVRPKLQVLDELRAEEVEGRPAEGRREV
jgi:hypothetical protein